MVVRNEIPLLEFDDSSSEVIAPDHGWAGGRLPEKCLFAFVGDVVHEYAAEHEARVADTLVTVSHDIQVYVLHEDDEDLCLVQSPIGAAASAQVLDTLVCCGCKKVISVGSCGVLANLEEDAFIVPRRALRAEGASYHYVPASRYIELDEEPIRVIEATLRRHGLPFVTCTTWSTDGFFRETKDMVRYRLEEGCSVVEMECAALAACCRMRGAAFGQLLFTADSLANVHEYDAREFGVRSHEKALLLGLDIFEELAVGLEGVALVKRGFAQTANMEKGTNMRRTMSIVAAGLLLLALVGCGGQAAQPTADEEQVEERVEDTSGDIRTPEIPANALEDCPEWILA